MPPIGLILLLALPPVSTQQDHERARQALQQARQAAQQDFANQGHICFAIRSYIFKRDDDSAPVLVKTTTCTDATPRLDRVSKPPAVKLVPANL